MAALTMAIAGHAENDPVNVEMLLSDWLQLGAPDPEGYYDASRLYETITVYALLTEKEIPLGIKAALDILPFVDGVRFEIVTAPIIDLTSGAIGKWAGVADEVHVVEDPFAFLIGCLADSAHAHLLINWEESDADDDHLIHLAHETGKIKVRDLLEGMVEITPDDPELEPAPEPEPEAPRARRKKREEIQEVQEELPDEPPAVQEKQGETPAVKAPAPQEPQQITIASGDIAVNTNILRDLAHILDRAALYVRAVDAQEAARNLKEIKEQSPLAAALGEQVAALNTLLHPELSYNSVVKESKPANPWGVATKVVWDEEKQEWKKAGRGRVRAGTRTGMMDMAGTVIEYK